MTKNHVGVYLHRMRIRWRREAIAEAMRTTGTAEEGLEELRALGFGAWLEG